METVESNLRFNCDDRPAKRSLIDCELEARGGAELGTSSLQECINQVLRKTGSTRTRTAGGGDDIEQLLPYYLLEAKKDPEVFSSKV